MDVFPVVAQHAAEGVGRWQCNANTVSALDIGGVFTNKIVFVTVGQRAFPQNSNPIARDHTVSKAASLSSWCEWY